MKKMNFKGKQNKLFFLTNHRVLSSKDGSGCVPQVDAIARLEFECIPVNNTKERNLFSDQFVGCHSLP